MKSKIIDILKDKRFTRILKTYRSMAIKKNDEFDSIINSYIKTIQYPRFTIPVIGVQGAGKSTLLNAIFFGDIILPVDSDETTCTPIEIRYSDDEIPRAYVQYKNAAMEEIECSEKGLRPFVHQAYNPANQKSIDRVAVTTCHPFLKTGVVVADIPGVGSITKENAATTQNYLKEAAGAIFLLRTIPPITRSESIFIQGIWPLMLNTFFIQNQWSDESDEDVEDGKDHSLGVLSQIAEKCQIAHEDIQIHIVAADQSLKAIIKNDKNLLLKSKLPQFEKIFKTFIEQWHHHVLEFIRVSLLKRIGASRREIISRKKSIEQTSDQANTDAQARRKQFETELEVKKTSVAQAIDLMKKHTRTLKKEISEICRISSENFRNEMREVINGGVTGGSRLDKAFSDICREQNDFIFGEIQAKSIDTFQKIIEPFSGIDEFTFAKADVMEKVHTDRQTNIHTFYQPAGSSFGGIGGMYAGASLGNLIAPVIGGIVGGIIGGILGGLFGGWIGKKGMEKQSSSQKVEARKNVFKLIEKFRMETEKNYKKILSERTKELETDIDQWLVDQEIKFEDMEKSIKSDMAKTDLEKQVILEQL